MIPFAIACAVSLLLTPLARLFALRSGLVDHPNERSSHVQPTPRSGGIAIMAAILIACAAMRLFDDPRLAAMSALAIAISLLGMFDDRLNLSARIKLIVQIAVALALVRFAAEPMRWWLAAIALIWIVGVTNGFNFMDGVNGIASLEGVVCGVAMGLLLLRTGDVLGAALAFAVGGAAAGFFPWNAAGRIFMGDVGSLALGFLLASLVIRGANHGVAPWIMAAPLLPFLLDTGITLVRRILRREKIYQAHRMHFYQQLTDLGWSHLAVASAWAALAACAAVVALQWPSPEAFAAVLLLHLIVFAGIAVRRNQSSGSARGSP